MEDRIRQKAIAISLAVGFLLLILKFAAYWITGSAAILSDALESIVNVVASGFAAYSIYLSGKPADRSHPYGHGKIEFFSAGVEGALICVAALVIIVAAVRGLIFGVELHALNAGLILVAAGAIINLWLGWFLIRTGKKTNSLTLEADGRHVLTDSLTSFAVIIGLVLVLLTGWSWLDPLVAILVALNILRSGGHLLRQSIGGLMNEADSGSLETVLDTLIRDRRPAWIDVHQLRLWKSGDRSFIDFHLTVPFYWTVEEGHATQEEVAEKIRQAFEGKADVLVHVDPCTPDLCRSCTVKDCPERTQPSQGQPTWTVETLISRPFIRSPESDRRIERPD